MNRGAYTPMAMDALRSSSEAMDSRFDGLRAEASAAVGYSANTLKTEPYAIWGFKAGFDNGGPVSAYVEARNIANKAYIASASIINQATPTSPLFEPGTGRAVYAGMKYRW